MSRDEQIVSVQVALKPRLGTVIDGRTVITASNVSQFEPSEEAASQAISAFSAMGFEIGVMVGYSFSITGSVLRFEEVFKTRIEDGQVLQEDGSRIYELPLDAIPEELARDIALVTFTPPMDFGPADF